VLIHDEVEISFIMISLMKQTLFLVTLIDIGTKLLFDLFDRLCKTSIIVSTSLAQICNNTNPSSLHVQVTVFFLSLVAKNYPSGGLQ